MSYRISPAVRNAYWSSWDNFRSEFTFSMVVRWTSFVAVSSMKVVSGWRKTESDSMVPLWGEDMVMEIPLEISKPLEDVK